MSKKLKVAVKKARKGDGPLKDYVMLATDVDDLPEYGEWLTESQARDLAVRLLIAAGTLSVVPVDADTMIDDLCKLSRSGGWQLKYSLTRVK
jgi:hypothetical protein